MVDDAEPASLAEMTVEIVSAFVHVRHPVVSIDQGTSGSRAEELKPPTKLTELAPPALRGLQVTQARSRRPRESWCEWALPFTIR